jgi:hypothetical protein
LNGHGGGGTASRIGAIALLALLVPVTGARAETTSFTRATPIAVTSTMAPPTRASPYPSTLFVPISGTVSGARVTLTNLNSPCPNDLDVVLVAPNGQSVLFLSDAGGCVGAHGTFTFDDAAPAAFTNSGTTPPAAGSYHPTNNAGTGTESFPAPGPGSGPFGAAFSTLAGTGVGDYWELFVVDDEVASGNTSTIAGGWTLELSYTPPAGTSPPAADTSPPETTLGSHPKKKTRKREAKFTFVSTEQGSTFQCRLDKRPFRPCLSPKGFKHLKPGGHVFRIAAMDPAGNLDASPARFSWRIEG